MGRPSRLRLWRILQKDELESEGSLYGGNSFLRPVQCLEKVGWGGLPEQKQLQPLLQPAFPPSPPVRCAEMLRYLLHAAPLWCVRQ